MLSYIDKSVKVAVGFCRYRLTALLSRKKDSKMRTDGYSRKVKTGELLYIATVLVVLAAISVPRISQSAQIAKQNICDSNISSISIAVRKYASDNQGLYPQNREELYKNVLGNPRYFPDTKPQCPFDGTYIIDPETKLVICSH